MDKYKLNDQSKGFINDLFNFWGQKGVSNLKIPQIGGRELDLMHLYKAVCKRGGFHRVCSNKLWKEIVLEFGLPRTCTSASFTLRNHYQKYLFAYEQKFFFQRGDDVDIPEVPGARPRKIVKPVEEEPQPKYVPQETTKHQSIENVINGLYQNVPDNAEIQYLRKYKTVPVVSEMNRILLSFESHMAEEVTFALNSLLLYSCNAHFHLEYHPNLLETLMTYLEEILKDVPFFKNIYLKGKEDKKLDVINNSNYPLSEILKNKGSDPVSILQEYNKMGVENLYKPTSEVTLIENIRTIFHIIRNFSFSKANHQVIFRNEKAMKLLYAFFLDGTDAEITKDCLDIFSNICQHIHLKNVPEIETFCQRIYKYLESDHTEEVESALECLKNLVFTQENESIIESHLNSYLDTIVDLLIYPKSDVRDSVLEFLLSLSDLKMATRANISKHPKSILRLMGLLVSGSGRNNDKTTRFAAWILSNLSVVPAAKASFIPYERDLFIVAASDSSVSKIISNILGEMENLTVNLSLKE